MNLEYNLREIKMLKNMYYKSCAFITVMALTGKANAADDGFGGVVVE